MKDKDLCGEKKFPDLEDDFFIKYDKKRRMTFIDEKDNIWVEDRKISSGGQGIIIDFISHNKEYSDLVAKFFILESEETYYLNMKEETEMVNFFNLHKCKNFMKMGVKEIFPDKKIVIMEKIDGDVYDMNFSEFKEPLKIYENMVNFIVSAFRCALKKDKYYMDIKEENIGYKICKKVPVFTLLDFGSFFEKDEEYIVTTYNINQKAYDKGYFSNEIILVYGTVITLLSTRLLILSKSCRRKFRDFIFSISEEDIYKGGILLDLNYYHRIEELFFSMFKKQDKFIDILFDCLYNLTKENPNITDFLNKISYYL